MDFAQARRNMVNSQVRANDVADLRIQAALETVPRERFLPPALRAQAYVERDIEYAPGRALLRVRDFAKLLDAAALAAGDLVLDVACGSGYASAVLASLAETVVGIDRDEAMCAAAQENLSALSIANAAVISGDPAKGAPKQGPFDVVFIGAAIGREPEELLGQLKDGGRLVAIRRDGPVARGTVWRRDSGVVSARVVFDASASAVLPEFAAQREFRF